MIDTYYSIIFVSCTCVFMNLFQEFLADRTLGIAVQKATCETGQKRR
jgi:hypothetical protein